MDYKTDRELLLFNIQMTLELLRQPVEANNLKEEMKIELTSLYTLRDSFNNSIKTLEEHLV
tara:strand:+ start:442 stop:624 length:183 start_codon:yes stop_codon:yes gene_type:complete